MSRTTHNIPVKVPDREVAQMQTKTTEGFGVRSPPRFPFRVVGDSEVIQQPMEVLRQLTPRGERSENGGRGTNYRVSMLLKLGVARLVRTAFYVTLDSDVFLKQPMDYSDLVPNGKAIVQGNDGQHRASWWRCAGGIVGEKRCGEAAGSGKWTIGVTPAIMSSELARGLLEYVEKKHGVGYAHAFFKMLQQPGVNDWTEYTTYWAYGCQTGTLEKYHAPLGPKRIYDTRGFAWGSFASYNTKAVFADNSTFFGVIQSINGAPSEAVRRALAPYLF